MWLAWQIVQRTRAEIEMIERLGEDAKRATFETANQLKWMKEIL
jgi:hypothetical protein